MSLGGGASAGRAADRRYDEQVEIAYDAANDQRTYAMESQAHSYNNAVLSRTIQERNLNRQVNFQERSAQRTWDYEVQQREHEFNSQVAAYNRSERLYGAQVGLNQRARSMANEAATAVRDERLLGVNYQGRQASLQRTRDLNTLNFQGGQADLQRTRDLNTLTFQGGRADLQRIKDLDTLAFQGGRADLQRTADLDTLDYQGRQADLTLSQTKADIGTQRAGLNIGRVKERANINQQQQSASLQRQQQRAESAFNSEKQLVEIMQAAGKAGARGQAGRSAEKTIQSIMAAGGRAQAQLADQITRGDSAYNLTMMGLDKSLIYSEADSQLSQSVLDTNAGYADLAYGLGVKERDATKLSIASAYDRAIAKSEFDEYGANLAADAKRMSEPGFAPLPPKPLELPRAILMDPMLPIDLPEVRKGAGSGGVGAAQGRAQDTAMIVNAFVSLATAGIGAMKCDMRVKHEVASLEYTEVDDTLSKLAFAVKVLREHS